MYQNNWDSLDSRPVPSWFEDAKFGIFIHWGLYSVPAYAPRGTYAEWYGHNMTLQNNPTRAFHLKHYGDRPYSDFVKDFKAELFDAGQWAELFEKAGARYMNLVSKHHDGYCMYPSRYAPGWNAMETGPRRDFCAELKEACDARGVRFGVYHSVYEWTHPLYLENPERYALEHLLPMLKELVVNYEPATLFTDGEWEHPSGVWHSTDFLAWLYNESPVREFIVPNDRWGKETRGRHGGNFTTEYGMIEGGRTIEDTGFSRPFEECRGIGASFGYNRMETAEDYLPAVDLIEMLVDLVSAGGNFLLNIGPAADGTIPAIMQDRLLEIGSWLAVNGEAVYGSRRLEAAPKGPVKFTRANGFVYAFLKHFPAGKVALGLPYEPGVNISLLGCREPVEAVDDGGRLAAVFPALNPDKLAFRHVYTLKISPAK